MSLRIQFQFRTREGKFTVDELLRDPSGLVNYYLQLPRLTCCDFQAGYCIDVNGKPWNGDNEGYDYDEPWMTCHWLYGLQAIFNGEAKQAGVGFWEQSTATVKFIDEDILEIEDPAAHAGGGVCAPAWVDAKEFCSQMISETKKYIQLCNMIEEDLNHRGDAVPKERVDTINNELYYAIFQQEMQKLETALARS